jgi:hypothetical protein
MVLVYAFALGQLQLGLYTISYNLLTVLRTLASWDFIMNI